MTNPEHEPYDDIGGWLVACGLLVVIVGLVLAGLLGLVALVMTA